MDVTTIHFLEQEDTDENGDFSFLALSDLPITICSDPECRCPLKIPDFNYNPILLKKTASYKLVQQIRRSKSNDINKAKEPNFNYPMPENVERSMFYNVHREQN